MNKLLTKAAKILVGLSLTAGVGVVVGSNGKEAKVAKAATGDSYAKVTDASDLTDGDLIIFVKQDGTQACGTTQNTNNRTPVNISLTNSKYIKTANDSVQEFTVKAGNTSGQFGFHTGNGYIYSASSSKNYLKTNTTAASTKPSGTSAWTISISSGVASVTNASNTSYYLAFNGTSYFSQYASGQSKTTIYKKEAPSKTVTSVSKKTAPTKTQYVSGESFDPAGLVVTVSYDSGDPEDVAYTGNETDFDWSPKTITADGNVEIQYKTYSTMKVTQAVTLVSVTNVTGVASHPSEVAVGKSIDPNDVTLNVSYSNSTTGTVKATSVSCDTSVAATGVTATATYSAASGTKTATFTINVVLVPGYDLVTSTGSLRNGAQVVIYSYAKQKILGNSAANSLRTGISLEVSEGDVDFIASANIPANTEVITLVQSGAHWELKNSANKYLSLTSDANAQNISDNSDTTNHTTEWNISFSGNSALIQSVAYSARYLECNSSNGNFGCYKGTQSKVQLYVLRNTDPYFSINHTSLYLGPRGTQTLTLTAHNNASDTVTWSTSNASIASIPANSTGMSVVVTGVAEGTATITATFGHPATYEALVCSVEVLDLQPYVNVGVTTFTKTTTKPSGGWAGTYLIGDSTGKTILNGSLSPLPGGGQNYATLSSLPDSLNASSELVEKSFTIKATETSGVYTIRSNSYYYIGNTTTANGMDTSIGQAYEVSISDSGVMTMNGTTLCYNSGVAYRFYQNTSENIRAAALWKADGEVREISNTLADWYDDVKSKNYLVCSESGSGSYINWEKLEETAAELSSNDLDTLENMTAKPSEHGGNYLEDLISDYDYLVAVKNYDDFLGREAAGTLSVAKAPKVTLLGNAGGENTNTVAIIVVISMVSVTAIGGYFFLKKRREQN